MKTRKQKMLCLLLSLALVLGSVTGIPYHADAATETAKKIIVYVAAEGTTKFGQV